VGEPRDPFVLTWCRFERSAYSKDSIKILLTRYATLAVQFGPQSGVSEELCPCLRRLVHTIAGLDTSCKETNLYIGIPGTCTGISKHDSTIRTAYLEELLEGDKRGWPQNVE
jgi:hypothetical protein